MGVWEQAQAALESGLGQIGQSATLIQRTSTGGSKRRPERGDTEHAVTLVDAGERTEASQGEGGLIVQSTRHRVVITTSGKVVPKEGNRLTFGGVTYTIEEVRRASPDGTDLAYTAYINRK